MEDIQELRRQLNEIKDQQMHMLNQRVDSIVLAFAGPATDYALMETAVYDFIDVPVASMKEDIQLAGAYAANRVLEQLIARQPKDADYTWSGPDETNDGFDFSVRHKVGLKSLGGLIAFIENENVSKEELQNWPPKPNLLSDSKNFLDAMYMKDVASAAYAQGKTREEVMSMRAYFQRRLSEFAGFASLEEGLDAVCAALETKGLTPTNTSKEAALMDLQLVFPPHS
jgi:hypothetical protein